MTVTKLNNRTLKKCLVHGGNIRGLFWGLPVTKHLLPRVLMAEDNSLVLYSFPKLPLSENDMSKSLRMPAELFLAFTSFVDTC